MRKSRPRPKKGPPTKCKVVKLRSGGKTRRRRVCWDKHGTIVRNQSPSSPSPIKGKKGGRKGGKKVKCKTKCPKGTRKVCTGGWRKGGKGSKKRVCKKYTCRRKR